MHILLPNYKNIRARTSDGGNGNHSVSLPIVLIRIKVDQMLPYVGHPISSDNGLISQKLVIKSEFYYPLHVATGVAYSC